MGGQYTPPPLSPYGGEMRPQQSQCPPLQAPPAMPLCPEPSAPPLQQLQHGQGRHDPYATASGFPPQHGQGAAFADAPPPNFQYPPQGGQQGVAGDVEMQPQPRAQLTPSGGLTCCEVFMLGLLGVSSIYLWFGLLVVLPVCLPEDCSDSFNPLDDRKSCEGVCELFYHAGHIPFIATMSFAGMFYLVACCCAVVSVSPESAPLREWLAKCEECRGVSPYVHFFIECYHYRTTGHGKGSRQTKCITHSATEDWQCTSSVDETTLPTLEDNKTYRVVTAVKVVPGDQYTAHHLENASRSFFIRNTRDTHQDKVVTNFIPGLPAQINVFSGENPPLLLNRTAAVISAFLLLALPFKIYEYCATTRAEVVFIKRVYRAPG